MESTLSEENSTVVVEPKEETKTTNDAESRPPAPARVTVAQLAPVGVLPGRLCVLHGPRVGGYTFKFHELGVTHVVTLLNDQAEETKARVVERQCQRDGAEWIWLPLQGAAPPTPEDFPRILTVMRQLREVLANDGTGVLIHCSAGLHRTGMIANALLRFIGHDEAGAIEVLRQSREKTASGVGTHRVAWADTFLAWAKDQA